MAIRQLNNAITNARFLSITDSEVAVTVDYVFIAQSGTEGWLGCGGVVGTTQPPGFAHAPARVRAGTGTASCRILYTTFNNAPPNVTTDGVLVFVHSDANGTYEYLFDERFDYAKTWTAQSFPSR